MNPRSYELAVSITYALEEMVYDTDLEDDGTNGNVNVNLPLSVVSKDRVAGNGEDVVVDVASSLGGRDESGLVLEEQRVGYEVDQL